MRDTDRDLTSVVVVRAGFARSSRCADLRGRRIATGAIDSPQSTLIPLSSCSRDGGLSDPQVQRFDVGVGLHGDHIGGERDAARALRGRRGRRGVPDRLQRPALRPRRHDSRRLGAGHRARPRRMTTAT